MSVLARRFAVSVSVSQAHKLAPGQLNNPAWDGSTNVESCYAAYEGAHVTYEGANVTHHERATAAPPAVDGQRKLGSKPFGGVFGGVPNGST